MNLDQLPNPIQFSPSKSSAFLQPDRRKPKFRHLIISLDVHMRRFITITRIEEESIRA
jgi:hypothetical protein